MILHRRHVVPLLLAVLWAFGTYHGGHAALVQFQDRATAADLVVPAQPVIAALQDERRLTALVLQGTDGTDGSKRLADQRARTDQLAAQLRRSAERLRVTWSGTPTRDAAARLLDSLAALPATRAAVDNRSADRQRAEAAYTGAVDAALRLAASPWPRTDTAGADRQRALAGLARFAELMAQEDTLVSAAPGGLGVAERAALAQLAGARRVLRADAVAGLAAPDRARLDAVPERRLTDAEDALLHGAAPAGTAAWRAAVDPALAAVRDAVTTGVREGARAAVPAGVSAVVQAGLFGGLGLVAVLTAYALSQRRPALAATEPDSGTSTVLLRLSQRNQALLHRQLAVLDELERRETDSADLAALFRADHLATQLRRNVEKAIMLSGSQPGRRWRRPVPAIDVARAAAASVERYPAVMVAAVDAAALAGPAVGDVTHLLIELIENATRFAPADATVWVNGELGITAYTFVVQDRGPGMTADVLAAARDVLARPYRPGDPARTGLRMAGRLAREHGIEIELDDAPRGGLVARVRIPLTLMTPAAEQQAAEPSAAPATRSDSLPVRTPGAVPTASAGLAPRRPSGPHQEWPPVDRTARFRDRLAARASERPAQADVDLAEVDLAWVFEASTDASPADPPAPRSTADETAGP